MGHKRNLSDDGIKSLSNKKSVSDMLKSLNNPPTALKDEGKDAGVNSHSEGKGLYLLFAFCLATLFRVCTCWID